MEQAFINELIEEINFARTNPSKYSAKLLEYEKLFSDRILKPVDATPILTVEGFSAFKEAADFLLKLSPMDPVTVHFELSRIAEDALAYVNKSNDIDSVSTLNIGNIIKRYGRVVGVFSEALDFGSETPALIVSNLLVNDGDLNRGNRATLLNPRFKIIGLATGKNRSYQNTCMVIYARHFFPHGSDLGELSDGNYEESNTKINNKEKNIKDPEIICTPIVESAKSPFIYMSTTDVSEDNKSGRLPEGVVKIDKQEREIIENGAKKVIVKLTKYLENGGIETEIYKAAR